MPPFRFSLQVLLDLRQRQRDEKARGLVEARRRLADAEQARDALAAARDAGRDGLARAHQTGGSVGHLRTLDWVVARLDDAVPHADRGCAEARASANASLNAYGDAVAGHRSVDRLRDRRMEDWRFEEGRLEQKHLDEMALSRRALAQRPTPDGAKS